MSTSGSRGVAIVTGGGRGIGREIARTLAASGFSVAVLARTQEQLDETAALIEKEGNQAVPFAVDITDQERLQGVVADVERQLGPVELLVNNAGVTGPIGLIWEEDFDTDSWWRCIGVNLRVPSCAPAQWCPAWLSAAAAGSSTWPAVSGSVVEREPTLME